MSDLRQREFNSLKILHHIDRLRTLAKNQDIAPVTIEIDPVSYCNHACGWCVDPLHLPVKMPIETYIALLAELSVFEVNGFGVEGIVLKGGGEPTLHTNFDAMVEHAASLGFEVGVVTNGSRLVKWAEILGEKAAYVRVSIDGPTPKSHKRIHKSDDFETIIQGIKDLLAARGSRRHPIIGLSFAMDIHSVDLVDEAIELGDRLGVNYVLIRPPFFEEVGSKPTMTIEEAQEVRRRLREAALAYNGSMEVLIGQWVGDAEQKHLKKGGFEASGRRAMKLQGNLPIEHLAERCLASPLLAVVTADGTLYGCCNLRALSPWAMGRLDYENGTGFAQLWAGSQRQEILSSMHRTACIQHCTHPLSRYNEIIDLLQDQERPHSQFV